MADDVRVLQLGAAAIVVINVGDLGARLDEWFTMPLRERPPRYAGLFEQQLHLPMQCILVRLNGTAILLDAGVYEFDEDSPFPLPGYEPPPGLLARLLGMDVQPEDVAHVVITHAHFDHYNGTTRVHDGVYEPCFPNARHYLGRADWEESRIQADMRDRESLPSRTLAVLHRRGLLELVAGDRELGGGVRIIAAPGESPGHQIVRVESVGQVLYYLGDLFHHVIEVEHPELMVPWADVGSMQASRQALIQAALADNALLIATHIPGAGRLQRTSTGVTWTAM
jgi:glyoxylase-like metal-dependent hydrolase (beta-lactamase superfamily II)